MNKLITWFAENQIAANLMMLLVVIAGLFSLQSTRKELIPNISLDKISISVAFLGASPKEVEKSICIRIEENIFDIEGINELVSRASEGICNVTASIKPSYNSRNVMDGIKARVDTISTFPEQAERAQIREISIKASVASVVVSGNVDEHTLNNIAEIVRDDLTEIQGITQVALRNAKNFEMAIELSETNLHEYDLNFDEVSNAVRSASLDLPAGHLKTDSGDVLLRTQAQAYTKDDFEQLTIRANTDGSAIKLADVAEIIDGFEDVNFKEEFNGKPSLLITVYRVGDQSVLDIADSIKDYIKIKSPQLPEGIELNIWQDKSSYFRSRMNLLMKNALTGLTFVFLILVLFLRFKLAFWVSLGIPVSFMGTFWLLPNVDGSINMISMFGFILVLGIVVDDAIVVGENIHKQHLKGHFGLKGAINGAQEVAKPVVFAVLTSVMAFTPLLFLPGAEGRLWMVIPQIVILTLLFSLIECLFILPAHLATIKAPNDKEKRVSYRNTPLRKFYDEKNRPISRLQLAMIKHDEKNEIEGSYLQNRFSNGLNNFIEFIYQPFLLKILRWRYVTLTIFLASFFVLIAVLYTGWIQMIFFPKVEGDIAISSIRFSQGTPIAKTEQAIDRIEAAALKLKSDLKQQTGVDHIENIISSIGLQTMSHNYKEGDHVGEVSLALRASENREISSIEIMDLWRNTVGEILGATQLTFQASLRDSGPDISVDFTGRDTKKLSIAAAEFKKHLGQYSGVYDIQDSFDSGKKEIRLHLLPEAKYLGVNAKLLARQVRQAFYGEEVQRIQRGRNDVKVIVRYPKGQRQSIFFLESMFIHLDNGINVPLSEVAEIRYTTSPFEILRIDRKRIITVNARIDNVNASPAQIRDDIYDNFLDPFDDNFSGVEWNKSGSEKSQDEIINSMIQGFVLAMIGIYALMAIPFKSYLQPLIVMSAIPFGLIGALLGHMLLGLDISLLSLSGMIAVAGVVVNDNLVLVDYINRNRDAGVELSQAIRDAGASRFRPIILTSLTTFAGLTPLMLERSVQAQFLIPMAVSLAFGVMFATIVSLLLVPASYYILEDFKRFIKCA